MTAFDTAVEQKSDPVFQVLDAAFAQVQLEQKSLTRRYMAITRVRGLASGLVRDGLAVALHIADDDLVVRVTVPGLSGVAADQAGDGSNIGFQAWAERVSAKKEAMGKVDAPAVDLRSLVAIDDLAFDSRAEDEAWCAELAAADQMAEPTEAEISGALTLDGVRPMAGGPTFGEALDEFRKQFRAAGWVIEAAGQELSAAVEFVDGDPSEGVDASPAVPSAPDPLAALIAAQEASEVQTDVPDPTLGAVKFSPWPDVAPNGPAPVSAPAFKSHWTDAEDDALIDATWDNMNTGMMQGQAISAASEAMGRTARAGLERVRRHLQPRLDAKLAANPIAAAGRIAAAVKSDGRGQHGAWPDMWTEADEARLVALLVEYVCAGQSRQQALANAATQLDRSKRACEGRLYGRLMSAFQAQVDARMGPGSVLSAKAAKVCGGVVKEWTAEENTTLVRIVADAICAGKTKNHGVDMAALSLGRPRSGVQSRILNKAKDDLAAELARRAAGSDPKPTNAAPTPGPAPVVLPPVSLPAADVVVRGGGVAPSAPAAPLPVIDGFTGLRLNEGVIAAAPKPRAPAIVADACPPRPAAGERASQVAPPDDLAPVLAHLRALTKGDAKALKADFAIMHLACAGFKMGDIATDLGLDSKHVKQRFEALCGYEGGKGRFLRSHVYEAIEHLLTPAAVVA